MQRSYRIQAAGLRAGGKAGIRNPAGRTDCFAGQLV